MPDLKLYQDLVEHLIDFTDGTAQGRELTLVKRACQGGVEALIHERKWQYYYRHGRIHVSAPYSTGTVAYDHTGGTYERQLTLTSGTWPDWAQYGRVLIGDVVYEVNSRESDTVITLKDPVDPDADIAAGTTYVIYRNRYPFPDGWRFLYTPETEDGWLSVWSMSPEEWMVRERNLISSGPADYVTVMADPDSPGGFVLAVDPYPSAASTLDFIMQVAPAMLRRTGFETASRAGTVSNTGTAVTGSGTSFSSDMVGSYMRFQNSTDYPTGLEGTNPFTEQHRILSVESATGLTLATTPDTNYSAKKYCISTPIDMDRTMFQSVLRAVEYELAVIMGNDQSERLYGRYQRELAKALEWDSKVAEHMVRSGVPYWMTGSYVVDLS